MRFALWAFVYLAIGALGVMAAWLDEPEPPRFEQFLLGVLIWPVMMVVCLVVLAVDGAWYLATGRHI